MDVVAADPLFVVVTGPEPEPVPEAERVSDALLLLPPLDELDGVELVKLFENARTAPNSKYPKARSAEPLLITLSRY